jgi:hypothetical protein
MTNEKQCENHARECARLATSTTNQELRGRLLDIGCEWINVAMQERLARAVDPLPPKLSRKSN